jgi:hypothetical protein
MLVYQASCKGTAIPHYKNVQKKLGLMHIHVGLWVSMQIKQEGVGLFTWSQEIPALIAVRSFKTA